MRLRAAPVLGRLALAAAGLALALTLAEVVVRVADLDFRPIRSRANEDAVLEQLEFRTRVVTNALGFRDRRLPGPKPPNTMRVVVLGDSFTQGYGVEEEQAYPRRLERLLDTREPARRHEVVNLGVPGACPLDYVAHLRDVGLGYEPDLVLVGLMANDVNDMDQDYTRDRRYGESMARLAQRLAVPLIDVGMALATGAGESYLQDDYHLSVVGHRRVAGEIASAVRDGCDRIVVASGPLHAGS